MLISEIRLGIIRLGIYKLLPNFAYNLKKLGKLKDDQTLPTNSDFSTNQIMTVEKYFQSFY
jgi:hypothetical protein